MVRLAAVAVVCVGVAQAIQVNSPSKKGHHSAVSHLHTRGKKGWAWDKLEEFEDSVKEEKDKVGEAKYYNKTRTKITLTKVDLNFFLRKDRISNLKF